VTTPEPEETDEVRMDRAEEEEMVMLEVEAIGAPVMARVEAVERVVAVDVPMVKAFRTEP